MVHAIIFIRVRIEASLYNTGGSRSIGTFRKNLGSYILDRKLSPSSSRIRRLQDRGCY